MDSKDAKNSSDNEQERKYESVFVKKKIALCLITKGDEI